MAKKRKGRQRIDTLIDAHVALRRAARTQGEWPPPPAAGAERDKVIVATPTHRRTSTE
jgi:hypothetical protein